MPTQITARIDLSGGLESVYTALHTLRTELDAPSNAEVRADHSGGIVVLFQWEK